MCEKWMMRNYKLDTSSRMERHPTLHTPARPKFNSFSATASFRKGLWPARSPDLTPPDYFLCGYLKGRVYQIKPRTIDALKANITEEIQAVTWTYWQGLSKIWRAGLNPVWTEMVATSSVCYDVVRFLTQ